MKNIDQVQYKFFLYLQFRPNIEFSQQRWVRDPAHVLMCLGPRTIGIRPWVNGFGPHQTLLSILFRFFQKDFSSQHRCLYSSFSFLQLVQLFARSTFSFLHRNEKMTSNTIINMYFPCLCVFLLCTLADVCTANEVSMRGGNAKFICDSDTNPIWLMQSHTQSRLHGIAMGDTKNARFDNQRFVLLSCFSIPFISRCGKFFEWQDCL